MLILVIPLPLLLMDIQVPQTLHDPYVSYHLVLRPLPLAEHSPSQALPEESFLTHMSNFPGKKRSGIRAA